MFNPNATASYSALTGDNDYGEPVFSRSVTVACAVIHFGAAATKTSVRTDSSASRGNAEERTLAAKILIAGSHPTVNGHRLIIKGRALRATSVEPRYAVTGDLDHYECDYEVWD